MDFFLSKFGNFNIRGFHFGGPASLSKVYVESLKALSCFPITMVLYNTNCLLNQISSFAALRPESQEVVLKRGWSSLSNQIYFVLDHTDFESMQKGIMTLSSSSPLGCPLLIVEYIYHVVELRAYVCKNILLDCLGTKLLVKNSREKDDEQLRFRPGVISFVDDTMAYTPYSWAEMLTRCVLMNLNPNPSLVVFFYLALTSTP